MTEAAQPSALAQQLLAIAHHAGQAILAVYQRQGDVQEWRKSDNTPLTEADLAAHQVIQQALQQLTPDIPQLSEEAASIPWAVRQQWSRYWLIDPLDGTREFLARNGEFTVNIALIENGEAILGVVHAPVTGSSYVGEKNHGAFCISNKGRTPLHARKLADRHPHEPVIVATSRRHGSECLPDLLTRIRQHWGDISIHHVGSALKSCLVAAGQADIYPRLGPTSEWDTAAAQAVVEAAGGSLVAAQDLQPLRYNQKDSLLNPDFYVLGDSMEIWQTTLENAQDSPAD